MINAAKILGLGNEIEDQIMEEIPVQDLAQWADDLFEARGDAQIVRVLADGFIINRGMVAREIEAIQAPRLITAAPAFFPGLNTSINLYA